MPYFSLIARTIVVFTCLVAAGQALSAQTKGPFTYDTTLYNKMEWREIGPFRGGRWTRETCAEHERSPASGGWSGVWVHTTFIRNSRPPKG